MSKPHVILIEQDQFLGDMYGKQLTERFQVSHVRDAQTAMDLIDKQGADAVVTDMILGKNNGVEVMHELRSYDDWTQIPIIILSSIPAHSFPNAKHMLERYNITEFLFKPRTSPAELMRSVSAAI